MNAIANEPSVQNDSVSTSTRRSNMLNRTAVLVKVTCSAYGGQRKDSALTHETAENHGVRNEALISTTKRTLVGKELNACVSGMAKVRLTVKKWSAPWEEGCGIMPARSIILAKVEIDKAIRDVMDSVDILCASLERIKADDRRALNGTYKESDYPTVNELRAKFRVHVLFEPVPTDFRTDLMDNTLRDDLQIAMDNFRVSQITEAKKDLFARVSERLATVIERMNAPKPGKGNRFHVSFIPNVVSACEEMRAANFDDDQAIESLAQSIETAFAKVDADSLRDNDVLRDEAKELAQKALADIQNAMAGFVG